MKKDFYTLAICTLLFLAGVIWANLVPSSNFWEIKIDGAFSVLSAIATATAAIAAWQAARFTAMQSATTARQARWQEYRFHYEEFRELLGNTEKVLNVEFHNPQAIYNRIFPKNRDIHAPFSLEGGQEIQSWRSTFGKLLVESLQPEALSQRDLEQWLFTFARLKGWTGVSISRPDENQLTLDKFFPTDISTGNLSNFISTYGQILASLCEFALIEAPPSGGASPEFLSKLSELIDDARAGRGANSYLPRNKVLPRR